ncbi:MAG: hypothetical protein V4717_23700 [Bacteroidota bacterium]
MAQIHVQPKAKSYWWLWLLLLLIIAGVVYYLYANNMLPGNKATIGNPTPADSSAVNDTAKNAAASDSALHYHNGITGQ